MSVRQPSWTGNRFLGPLVCALWAGWICYLSGQRGFFALDQSIVMNGAWRILSGQVPFRDFYLPYGPVSIWIQAAAFQIGGLSFQTYVLTAVVMNIGGACLAYGTFRTWIPERRWAAWVAGLMTGSWLYAPMGTAYVEQTGFFFLWAAIFGVARGAQSFGRARWTWFPLAGLALAAAMLSKTNTGLLAVPVLFVMAAVLRGGPMVEIFRDGLGLALGLGLGFAAFYGWLVTASDPGSFVRSVLEIAGQEGKRRLSEGKSPVLLLGSFLNGKGNDLVRTLTATAYLLMALGLAATAGPWKKLAPERLRRLATMGLLWVAYQQAFGMTSSNNGINERPFTGLIFVCAVTCVLEMTVLGEQGLRRDIFLRWSRSCAFFLLAFAALGTVSWWIQGLRSLNFLLGGVLAWGIFAWAGKPHGILQKKERAVAWGSAGVLTLLFLMGTWGSYFRQANDIFSFHTRYVFHGEIPGLRGLAWAEGVKEDARDIHATWEEFVETWKILRNAPGRFFLFGDYTVLYAITGKSPVGMFPWFHQGLTYSASYDLELDLRLAGEVDQPDVTYFVTEGSTFMVSRLQDFPRLEQVLMKKYRLDQKIGLFRLYRRIATEGS